MILIGWLSEEEPESGVGEATDPTGVEARVVVTDSGRNLNGSTLVRAKDAQSWVLGRGYGTVGVGLGTALQRWLSAGDHHHHRYHGVAEYKTF